MTRINGMTLPTDAPSVICTVAYTAVAGALLLLHAASFANEHPDRGERTGDRAADRERLLQLNEQLVRTQIIERDATFFDEIAVDEFRVLAPGGMIESKEQAIAGVTAWNVTDVTLSGTEVVFRGNVAIMTGRMDIDGTMQPVGRWGPLKYMSTWIKEYDEQGDAEEGEWRLLSRSLTPCLDRLIEIGRC